MSRHCSAAPVRQYLSVPLQIPAPYTTPDGATHTYRVHYAFDYYRFSEQAVRQVFFEGMERVRVRPFMTPPRIFGHGYKPRPASRSTQARALARRTAGRARRLALRTQTRL